MLGYSYMDGPIRKSPFFAGDYKYNRLQENSIFNCVSYIISWIEIRKI